MTYWRPGTQIVWRYGDPGLDFAAPMIVAHDDADTFAAWLPAGTPVLKLIRADGRDLCSVREDAFTAPRRQIRSVWTDYSVLRVYLPGRSWSLWHFFEERSGEFTGWHANLEAPHVRSGTTLRSRDHLLDLWIEPDRSFGRKDEHELAAAVEQGRHTADEAAAIVRTAEEVEDVIPAWDRPFCDGWRDFRPDPDWPVPTLP